MSAATLLPVCVLLPLGTATLMLALAHWLPARPTRLLSVATALLVALLCAALAREAMHGPAIHWFGGWSPERSGRPDVVLGISFLADPASAAVAAFCGFLFAAALAFASGYFDAVHSHFQVLMLLFLAAMVGFCLTHDLFNLFVWFELMSVVAFALTAYPLGKSSLEGAFNFTITNALASFLMLAGVGLLYARAGTLDMAALGRFVARQGTDPVLVAGVCLMAAALLTKAAIVPFQFWLADAHAVAPSPVSVIFSGAMVPLGLFGLAKILGQGFGASPLVTSVAADGLGWLGVATALVGGLMAFAQRHLKRLLAFSTVAHVGIMLIGVSAPSPAGPAGFLVYLVGHGATKGALFMVAGILLALRSSADEIRLRGRGRALWPVGVAMAAGGLLLGGLPLGLTGAGSALIDAACGPLGRAATVVATALTGAAVLRAAARIFLGCSGAPGVELFAPTEGEREKADRPLWLMLTPCAALLVLAFLPNPIAPSGLETLVAGLLGRETATAIPKPPLAAASLAPLAATLVLFGLPLLHVRPTRPPSRRLGRAFAAPAEALQWLHSGLVADYVTWMAVGLALMAFAFRT